MRQNSSATASPALAASMTPGLVEGFGLEAHHIEQRIARLVEPHAPAVTISFETIAVARCRIRSASFHSMSVCGVKT